MKKQAVRARGFASSLLVLVVWAVGAQATTRTATSGGNWTNATIWSGTVPQAGEDAVINSGVSVTVDVSTASLNTFTNYGTLVFSGTNTALNATSVTVTGTVTHLVNTATNAPWTPDHWVSIACSNLTVTPSGSIDVSGKGYQGAIGNAWIAGYGPGAGAGGLGGGYGGRGGNSGGITYGTTNAPDWSGSGGGSVGGNPGRNGGNGGGLVRIQATGQVSLDGTIKANGTNAGDLNQGGGGGAGGGIYIACRTITSSSGRTMADGGKGATGNSCSGGGGGRIAVIYDATAQAGVIPAPSLRLSAAPGTGAYSGNPGTVYLPDTTFYPYTNLQDSAFIVISNLTSLSLASLTISNAWIRFQEGMQVNVTNGVQISGSSGRYEMRNQTALTCGSLVLTNSATMYIYSGPTNGPTWTNYGAKVDVTGDVALATNCWIYAISDSTNGGSVWFHAQTLAIATNAGVNGSSGYLGGVGPNGNGYGPGAGKSNGSNPGGGGGYGGTGAYAVATTFGWTYGSSNAPVQCGSGGGAREQVGRDGGAGGGLVWLEIVGRVTLNGSLLARGSNPPDMGQGGGGGSGGGIYLRCDTLDGSSAGVRADAGTGSAQSGGGGGGRIALWNSYLVAPTGTWTVTVNGGGGKGTGAPGTIVWGQFPAGPTVDNSTGASSVAYFSATLNGTLVKTGTAVSSVSVFWGPTDGGTNKAAWTNTIDFGVQTAGTMFSTNLAGLDPGRSYFYRFYGSNSAAERWATISTNFTTPAPLPAISNAAVGATGISLTSATLNGSLVSTGTAPTMVSVFWGPTDGSTNMAGWAKTNAFAGYVGVGSFSTNVSLSVSNAYYYYTFYATNAGGETWATPSVPFFAGSVTLVATDPSAVENGANNTGVFTVSRPLTVTNLPVTVNYAISGTASNGSDYAFLPGSVAIPAGATSNTFTIAPIMDAVFDSPDKRVTLTLTPGAYAIGWPSNDTVTIQDVAPSATNLWTGTGNWTNRANWSDAIEPLGGQNVVIAGGTVTLASASASLGNLTVTTNATVVFSSTNAVLTAANVFIAGTVTHNPNTATNAPWTLDNRVSIVCSNLTVATNGVINVNQKGFGGGTPASFVTGYGPGGGAGMATGSAGGGYGGAGGNGSMVYGPTNAPVWPGSGGGSGGGGSERLGGAGGGLVIIQASGNVGIEGSITARGGDAGNLVYGGAGGSGGGIYIACRTFTAAAGRLSADGGPGGSAAGGGGGGGRIAVVYDPVAQSTVSPSPTPRLSAAPGTGLGSVLGSAAPGTVYLPDVRYYPYTTMQDNAFVVISNLTNWSVDTFTISNVWVRFQDGLRLNVTNSVQATGSGGRLEMRNQTTLTCGSLLLTNGAKVVVYSGPTNAPIWTNCGAKVDVAGSVVLGTTCWIYPISDPTTGGSVWFHAQTMTIATNAGFDANSSGYPGGGTALDGFGPGRGRGAASSVSGGGYGGTGGNASGSYGQTYGSSNAPVDPGSGGGGLTSHGSGGRGGGLVHLEVDNALILDGTIRADGQNVSEATWDGGGGSGGGIYIKCLRFGGVAPILSAIGGSGGTSYCGGGGGGRIAIWRVRDAFSTVTTNVAGGGGQVSGATGTVVWGITLQPGTVFTLR